MTDKYDDRSYTIKLIVDKIWNAFSHTPKFVLDIGKAITEKAETELRYKQIHKETK